MYEVLSRLPFTSVKVNLIGEWINKEQNGEKQIDLREYKRTEQPWMEVYTDCEYTLKVSFSRKQLSERVT